MLMTKDEIKIVVLSALAKIAPEIEGEDIEPDVNFRDQFDIDSFDFLNLMIALHEELGVDIQEVDYPKFSNLSSSVSYLATKLDIKTKY